MSIALRTTVTGIAVATTLAVANPSAAGETTATALAAPLSAPALGSRALTSPTLTPAPALVPSAPPFFTQVPQQPGTLALARTGSSSRTGRWLLGTLASAAERDWFRFRVAEQGTMLITLGGLPADYRLALFASDGRQLAASDRPGQEFEQLAPTLARGEYFVEVSSSRGTVDASRPYRVLLRPLAGRLMVLDAHRVANDELLIITGQLLNNSSGWRQYPRVTARFFGAHGEYLGRSTALAEQTTLAPGARGVFRIIAPHVSGVTSYTLAVSAKRVAAPAQQAVEVQADVPYATDGNRIRYVGRVTGAGPNTPGQRLHVHVLRYNRIGALVDYGHVVVPRGAGTSARYEIELPAYDYLGGTRITWSVG